MEISQDLGHRPLVFIRFNPDDYANEHGKLIKSCWKLNALGIMQIIKGRETEWNERLENLKKWIRQNGLENSIVFLGELFHQNLPKYIIPSDVFINMSHTGSMDKVVLEAMACGIPVLTSNEAYVEILRPFNLIIGSTDSKALADKIIFIFNQKEYAQSLGEKLRDIVVREHNLLRLIKKIVEKI